MQTSARSVPSPPAWLGEVVLIAHHLRRVGVLSAIAERVRFARRRFGRYEVIDFVAILIGYTASGERTLETFYEGLLPFASAFMALFGRDRLPARSTLSRFLAALTPEPVEALRTLFLEDGLSRPLGKGAWNAGLPFSLPGHFADERAFSIYKRLFTSPIPSTFPFHTAENTLARRNADLILALASASFRLLGSNSLRIPWDPGTAHVFEPLENESTFQGETMIDFEQADIRFTYRARRSPVICITGSKIA